MDYEIDSVYYLLQKTDNFHIVFIDLLKSIINKKLKYFYGFDYGYEKIFLYINVEQILNKIEEFNYLCEFLQSNKNYLSNNKKFTLRQILSCSERIKIYTLINKIINNFMESDKVKSSININNNVYLLKNYYEFRYINDVDNFFNCLYNEQIEKYLNILECDKKNYIRYLSNNEYFSDSTIKIFLFFIYKKNLYNKLKKYYFINNISINSDTFRIYLELLCNCDKYNNNDFYLCDCTYECMSNKINDVSLNNLICSINTMNFIIFKYNNMYINNRSYYINRKIRRNEFDEPSKCFYFKSDYYEYNIKNLSYNFDNISIYISYNSNYNDIIRTHKYFISDTEKNDMDYFYDIINKNIRKEWIRDKDIFNKKGREEADERYKESIDNKYYINGILSPYVPPYGDKDIYDKKQNYDKKQKQNHEYIYKKNDKKYDTYDKRKPLKIKWKY